MKLHQRSISVESELHQLSPKSNSIISQVNFFFDFSFKLYLVFFIRMTPAQSLVEGPVTKHLIIIGNLVLVCSEYRRFKFILFDYF